jgi:hypothetical protein
VRACVCAQGTLDIDLSIYSHLQGSKTICFSIMPPKSSVLATTASSVSKSPPKTRRSNRKRAQSSTSATAEPPAKKVAPSAEAEDEEISAPRPKGGKARRGKATRCVRLIYDLLIYLYVPF